MLVKFLAHGTGSAGRAASYLLGERDAAGKAREGVEVLRGDPDQVAAVADTLPFEHRYTSGVIAWAPEDKPTDAQIGAVLDAFEKTAWAGLEPDRYAWAAVLHREEGGSVHVHVLTARCDLETGRSLNIAPPGWEKTFGPLRDAFNAEHGWARPDDPARARAQQPVHLAYVEAARLRAGLRLEASPRDLIRDYLLQRVEHGTVRNRHDDVAALREAGLEVPRQGKDYLTARDPESGQRWRLKGGLYAVDFQRERIDRAAAEAAEERAQGDGGEWANSHSMGRRTVKNDAELDPVRRRLLRLVADSRTNLHTASLAIERNATYLHQFIHRGSPRVLAEDDREALAEYLGCSPDLLRHDRAGRRAARPGSPPPGPYSAPKGYSVVPEIDVRAAAGSGAWNDELEEIKEAWLFADPLIRHEFRAKPDDLRMITVDGDSMEPLLSTGDRIMIDVSRQVPSPPGIFVIWDGLGLVAKRIEHVPHSDPPRVVLKSLNPEYDSYERSADEIRVVGRAVWASRKL